MKNILIFLIIAIILVPVFYGCAQNDVTEGDVTTAVALADDTNTGATETEFAPDDLGGNINFNNEKVTILYWSDVQNNEFEIAGISGNLIDDAIYERNRKIEERLGVDLGWIGTPGNYENQAAFVSTAQNDVLAGGTGYDIFAGYSMTAATLALKGCTQNLLALDYLNFKQPWWPESLITQSTISNQLYFCSGDISCNMLYMMFTIYFNKDMITKYNLESPYEIVGDNRWTVDKMIEMATGIYLDLNGNGAIDASDSFGMVAYNVFYDAFFWGSNLTAIEKDSGGNLVVSDSWNSEKTINLLNKICPFFNGGGYAFFWTSSSGLYNSFGAGNDLFALTESQYSIKFFADKEISYGVVPIPKYDSDQSDFITALSFPYTMYSVSLASSQADTAAAVLECYASESYRGVTPAVFETSFKYKYSSGNEDVAMWDIIRSGVCFDLGRVFSSSLSNYGYNIFRSAVTNNTASSFASQFQSYRKFIGKAIENIQSTMDSFN